MKPAMRFVTMVPLAALFGAASAASPAFAQDGPAPAPAAETSSPAPEAGEAPASPTATPEPAPAASPSPAPPASDPPSELPVLASGGAATGGPNDRSAGEPDDGALRHHQDHFLGFAGVRVGKISSEGLDPFSDSDELAQFSLGFGKTLITSGNFSLAGLIIYDIGGHSDEARGAESELTVHRLTVGAEARYHFIRQLFVFGRVAPGAVHSIAQIEDQTAGAQTLAARNWVFATDLSAGATFELTGWSGESKKRRLGVWLTFDGGYGITGESDLTLTADGDGGPERAEPVELGPLALGGPFLRFAALLTY